MLLQLAQLYGLTTVERQLGDFLEDGYLSGEDPDYLLVRTVEVNWSKWKEVTWKIASNSMG